MKYTNNTQFEHSDQPKIGVLLVNLGTPDAPTKQALKKYLKEFLSDPRVVEPAFPRWIWWLILNGIILNLRPKRSAEAYATVWDSVGQGSPLLAISEQQQQAIAENLSQTYPQVVTALAMRYGNPSIKHGLQKLRSQQVEQLLVLPLYPQYSATTTASVFDAVTNELQSWRHVPELRFINHYHDHPDYIQALANSVRAHWQIHGQADQLLMSFHGIPKRYLLNGDMYHCECLKTGRLLAEALELSADQYQVTFQSIFGREEWLKPYTMDTLKSLPEAGHQHVQVICPGFAADCLETLEEIQVENKGYFIDAGGQKFSYIPALNSDPAHIELLSDLIKSHIQTWVNTPTRETGETTKLYQQQTHNKP